MKEQPDKILDPKATQTTPPPTQKTTGWFVVRWMSVLFGAMFVANGLFVYFALNSHSGEQSTTAYEDGLNYNNTIAERRKMAELGWIMSAVVENINGIDVLNLKLLDKDKSALQNITIEAQLFNPVFSSQDTVLVLTRIEDGYKAPLNLPRKGQWDLMVRVTQGKISGIFSERIIVE